MNQDEFTIHYQKLLFKVACYEKKGDEFQDFFALIMERHDSSFIAVRSHGNLGDFKCDGYSQDSKTVYQCYAPDDLEKPATISYAQQKIKDDYAGARKYWFTDKKKWMNCWTFVWSHYKALPAPVVQTLQELKDSETEISICDWGSGKLWEIIEPMSDAKRVELFGLTPELEAVTEVTAAEIQVLLNYLARNPVENQVEDLSLLAIIDKLEKNDVGPDMQSLIKVTVPMTTIISDYFVRFPDWQFQETIKNVIIQKYYEFSAVSKSSDEIFWKLIHYIKSPANISDKHFFAAVGIVAHYFQLCTIFEK